MTRIVSTKSNMPSQTYILVIDQDRARILNAMLNIIEMSPRGAQRMIEAFDGYDNFIKEIDYKTHAHDLCPDADCKTH